MRIYKTKDYDALSRKAASVIAAQVTLKPDSVLGLATGSSPLGTYKYLIERFKDGELDFSEVKTANLDEYRGLTRENDQSYYYFMYHNLFQHININMENTNIPDGTASDAKAEAARYDQVIRGLGGVDLQLLGLGHNGHIGFNEPSDYFAMGTHCVDLQPSTIEANKRFFASIDDVPKQAFTMGIGTIMAARKILLIVSGNEKGQILYDALCGPVTSHVPASILQMHPNVIVVADEAALSKFNL